MTTSPKCTACGAPSRDPAATTCAFCGVVLHAVPSATMVRRVVEDVLREDRDRNGIPDAMEGRGHGKGRSPVSPAPAVTPNGARFAVLGALLAMVLGTTVGVLALGTSGTRRQPVTRPTSPTAPPAMPKAAPADVQTSTVETSRKARPPSATVATVATTTGTSRSVPVAARPTAAPRRDEPAVPPEPAREYPISMVRVSAVSGHDRNALNRQLDALDVRACGVVVPKSGGLQLHFAFQTTGDRAVVTPSGSTPSDFAATAAGTCISNKVRSATLPRGSAESGTFTLAVFYTTT